MHKCKFDVSSTKQDFRHKRGTRWHKLALALYRVSYITSQIGTLVDRVSSAAAKWRERPGSCDRQSARPRHNRSLKIIKVSVLVITWSLTPEQSSATPRHPHKNMTRKIRTHTSSPSWPHVSGGAGVPVRYCIRLVQQDLVLC